MTISVSRKHGVNPSVSKCFYCLEDSGVALFGRLPGDEEAPHNCGVIDMQPCANCEDLMHKGIIMISIRDGESDKINSDKQRAKIAYDKEARSRSASWRRKHPHRFIPNPYRTGGWVVVTEDAFTSVFQGQVVEQALSTRWCFVEDEVWDAVGLPRGEQDGG